MDREEIAKHRKAERKKKGVLAVAALLIILPAVLCILLYVQVCSLQKQMDALDTKNTFMQTKLVQVEKALTLTGTTDSAQQAEEDTGTQDIVLQITTSGDVSSVRTAYLTFDDGPSNNTEEILDILKEYGIKATFFVTGKTDENSKKMYKRIVQEGHTLGMHSYSHKYSVIYESVDAFAADIKKLQDYLEEVTGVRPMLYRFPGGSSNKVSNTDMKQFIAYLNKEGIVYFDWNVSCGDAQGKEQKPEVLVQNVMKDINLYKNSVILMHDANDKKTTVEALPEIIKQLRLQGIDMKAIDNTQTPVQHISAASVPTE